MKKLSFFILISFIFVGFISSQTITVTSPHTGDTWYKGSTYTITWTKTGTMGNFVKIKLRNSSSTALVMDIINHIPNNGNYSWEIPTSIAPGNYVIRIRTMDNEVYVDSNVFEITDPPVIVKNITVTSPNGGETWYCGKTYSIDWVSKGCGDRVEIHVISGTEIVRTLKKSYPNVEGFNRYSWTISEYGIPSRIGYKILIRDLSDIWAYGKSNDDFLIQKLPDLVVRSIAFFDDSRAPKPSEVWLKVAIKNVGKAHAPSSIALGKLERGDGSVEQKEINIKSLDPNEEFIQEGPIRLAEGKNVFAITVDYNNQINESDESNNTMRREYYFRYMGLPKIYEFGATARYIGYGEKTTLQWRIEDADSAKIEPVSPSVDPIKGSMEVFPCSTREYTLTARNRNGITSSSTKVNVRELSISSPKKGDIWIKGNSYYVRWDSGKDRDITAVIGLMGAPYISKTPLKSVPNNGSCLCMIPEDIPLGNYKIEIVLRDKCRAALQSDAFSISESFTDLRIKNCDLMKEIFFKGDTATIRFRYYNDGNQPINAVKVKVQSVIKSGRMIILKKSYNEKTINYHLNSGQHRDDSIQVKIKDDSGKNYRFQLIIYPEPGTLKDDKTASNNFCYTETFVIGFKLKDRKLIRK